jgi:uncharacterized protein YwlG (UPF0340 family)
MITQEDIAMSVRFCGWANKSLAALLAEARLAGMEQAAVIADKHRSGSTAAAAIRAAKELS